MSYFDSASSAPLHPVARQALQASLDEGWADPARLYREGRRAGLLLDTAREAAAEAVGCRPDELVFTPSGTQAVHAGMSGALFGRRRVGAHVVVSAVEHSSVLHAARSAADAGGSVTEVPVGRPGAVAPDTYAEALRADTALACLQSANHEVGTVQPVAEVAEACRDRGVPLLVDAAQSLGWGRVEGAWSLLAASAHKWGGPPGVGLLAVRKGVRFAPQGPADERESGRVPGFVNIPAVVAAVASLRAVRQEAAEESRRLAALVDLIRARVPELVGDVEVVGDPVARLPHLVTFSCLYADGETLLHELDRLDFSVSSGSSCTSDTLTPSHVLRAMGVLSEGNVRVSLPRGTRRSEVERFLDVLPGAVAAVRAQLDAPARPAGASGPSGPSGSPEPSGLSEPSGPSEPSAPPGPPGPGKEATGAERPEAQEAAESRGPAGGPEEVAPSVVDALGRRCPIPVIELAKIFDRVPVGGTVTVLSDDEAARLDIPAWCEMRGQEYVGERPADRGVAYVVRRLS